MVTYTSIQLLPATRERLAHLKKGNRATYDDIINKLLRLVPKGDDEGTYTDEFRVGLLNARIELKEGKKISLREAKSSLGL